jgi:ketosteroid isomerase-like protein
MSHHEHPNATLIRESHAAWQSSDVNAMTDTLTDDVEWHEIGNDTPVMGKAALAARWAGMAGSGGTFSSDLHDAVANDDHGVALVTTTVGMGDKSLTYRTAEIYHFRDGKISARWAFSDDTEAINKFFGGM